MARMENMNSGKVSQKVIYKVNKMFIVAVKHNSSIQSIHKRMVRFQKLTTNLFLTLHGHNLHRQQRQLSKFLVRYQQFASHAYCGG